MKTLHILALVATLSGCQSGSKKDQRTPLPNNGSGDQKTGPGQNKQGTPGGQVPGGSPGGQVPGGSPGGQVPARPNGSSSACPGVPPDYGFPPGPIPGKVTQYASSGSLSQLPALAVTASTPEIKAYVAKVYTIFPQFKQIFEDGLGLSQTQALAFMYADMSIESGKDGHWQIDLETATPSTNPANAWGPFQAAVTNFAGFTFDTAVEKFSGLPVPTSDKFKDAPTSTYAGMKRLADGVLNSMTDKYFGLGQPARLYLLGTLADHNTGYPSTAKTDSWLQSYGNQVLRLAPGYQQGANMTNDKAYWTGQPDAEVCAK